MKIEGSTMFKCCTAGHELVEVRAFNVLVGSYELILPDILLVKGSVRAFQHKKCSIIGLVIQIGYCIESE